MTTSFLLGWFKDDDDDDEEEEEEESDGLNNFIVQTAWDLLDAGLRSVALLKRISSPTFTAEKTADESPPDWR
jgi:hypothetical protein